MRAFQLKDYNRQDQTLYENRKKNNVPIKSKEADRRRGGKTISKSGQEWTLHAQLGQLKTGQDGKLLFANSSVVPRRASKVMG